MAHRAFGMLRQLAAARHAALADGAARTAALDARLATVLPGTVSPPPLVTGDDLAARGVPAGPIYRRVLDALYTRQLDETLHTRAAALAELDKLLRQAEGEP